MPTTDSNAPDAGAAAGAVDGASTMPKLPLVVDYEKAATISGADGAFFCVAGSPEEAALIVNAINNHEALVARIRELEAQQQWQPIETAPKDGKSVLITGGTLCWEGSYHGDIEFTAVTIASFRNGDWEGDTYEGQQVYHKPTLWQPIPSASRFAETFCSQCGGKFGPRNSGYSHCSDHAPAPPKEWPNGQPRTDSDKGE